MIPNREKIKKSLFDYSIAYGYGDDLNGALISAIQILDLDLIKALEEIIFILRYESGKEQQKELEKVLKKEFGK